MRKVNVVLFIIAMLVTYPALPQDDNELGSWFGQWHAIGAAFCQPNCKILGGGRPEGTDFDTPSESFPANALLKANKGTVECSDGDTTNGCTFLVEQSVKVDNGLKLVSIHGRVHGGPVKVRAVVPYLRIQ